MNTNVTIFEYLGGAPALLELTETFYKKVKADALLQPVFKDFTDDHVHRVALWLGEVFRGPEKYTSFATGISLSSLPTQGDTSRSLNVTVGSR
jgi:hemoglobin